MSRVHFNGRLVPIEQAMVPVTDRGFLFGDGVYEVIPVYSRRPFRLAQHLDRLQASLDAIRLANPHSRDEWTAILDSVIAATDSDDQSVYLQITRGVAERRNHAFPSIALPTVLVMAEALAGPGEAARAQGVAAISAADIRWLRCNIKSVSLLANVLLRQQAIDAGCAETILFRDGVLTEAAAANVFAVRDGILLAPPKNHLMLPGITYDVILELAAANGLPCEVRDVFENEVREADEVWLSSSAREVLAVVSLDGKPVGRGVPGPQFARMNRWYQDFKSTVMRHGG